MLPVSSHEFYCFEVDVLELVSYGTFVDLVESFVVVVQSQA